MPHSQRPLRGGHLEVQVACHGLARWFVGHLDFEPEITGGKAGELDNQTAVELMPLRQIEFRRQRLLIHHLRLRLVEELLGSVRLLQMEIELHLHPTWQRRLINSLRNFNDGNQFIITTHSPTLEQSVLSESIIQLGKLDVPDWQYETVTETEDNE